MSTKGIRSAANATECKKQLKKAAWPSARGDEQSERET
jgi:hypothetical protein